ncbi:hypothetical protein PPL_11897 [Heterostelium album PN500]|uniref:Uncharacterized protein n=1 Tax=Heterostelium pallidum (strain ATCC 26659 / Pp 5 / PN500) TaxID=670386 RepID=D3BUS5_HETP5|nr:hypothetical protein PPL_11897 [Heterostelium album PN500]EFA74863.1 hypothetical protein PPL_11897 [Heterostelium album PN500]|eukprot:XP_020426997.1 hypothetical protein PPL_11897 [Heterostelium album PN500]
MGSILSIYNNKVIAIENSNQTILPDIIWRYIIELLANQQSRYHRHDWNVLTLSLISHYWLVKIIAKVNIRITTLTSNTEFIKNYPLSYERSLLKLNNNNNNNDNNNDNNNNNNNNNNNKNDDCLKFNLSKLTLIYLNQIDSFIPLSSLPQNNVKLNHYLWIEAYNDALSRYWSVDSMTIINLPYNQIVEQLSITSELRELRIYLESSAKVDGASFPKLERFALKQKYQYPVSSFDLSKKCNLLSLSLTGQFNQFALFEKADPSWFHSIQSFQLNHAHNVEWNNETSALNTMISIDLSACFINVTQLKLGHSYHRIAQYSAMTKNNGQPISILSELRHLRYLSITNHARHGQIWRDGFNLRQSALFIDYQSGLTRTVFLMDMASIGHQLHTLKLKGECCSLFGGLLSAFHYLCNLQRLTLGFYPLDDPALITQILKSTTLTRLSAKITDNSILDSLITNNKSIISLKIDNHQNSAERHQQLVKLSTENATLQDIRLMCIEINNDSVNTSEITYILRQNMKYKYPKSLCVI